MHVLFKIKTSIIVFIIFTQYAFSQYNIGHLNYNKSFNFNPSYSTQSSHSLNISHRQTLPFYNSNINNSLIEYSLPLTSIKSGIGFSLQNYNEGKFVYNSTRLLINFAHQIQINRDIYLHGGLTGGFWYNSFSKSNLQFETSEILQDENSILSDFSFGLTLEWKKHSFAVCSDHLIPKNINNAVVNRRTYNFEYIGIFPISNIIVNNEISTLTPLINLQFITKEYWQISYGNQISIDNLTTAITFTHIQTLSNTNIGLSLGYIFTKFALGYTFTLWQGSNLQSPINSSSHEVTFSLHLKYKRNNTRYKRHFY